LCFVFKVQETDSGKPVVCFAVVMDLQDSSSLPSSSSSASAAGSRSPSDQTLAWVISRQLQDFVSLHQQLLKVSRCFYAVISSSSFFSNLSGDT